MKKERVYDSITWLGLDLEESWSAADESLGETG